MDYTNNCLAKAAQEVTAFTKQVTTFVSCVLVDQGKLTEEVLNKGHQVEQAVSDVEDPRSLLLNEAVVVNVNQTDVDVSDATTLVHQTTIGAQATCSFDEGNPISLSSIQQLATNRNTTIIDQSGTDPIYPQAPIAAPATSTLHIQDPRNLPREVVSDGNSEVRNETHVDMSDTVSLLPQLPIAAEAQGVLNKGNQVEQVVSDVEDPRSLLPNEAVVVDVNQTDVDVSDATTLVHQTTIGAQATCSFYVGNPIILSSIQEVVNNGNVVVRDEIHVDVSDTTSLLHQTPVVAQAPSSFYIDSPGSFSPNEQLANQNTTIIDQSGTDPIYLQAPIAAPATSTFHIQDPRNLPREVVSEGNSEVRNETHVDMSDTVSLPPQPPIAAEAQGGEENSPGVANVVLGMPSQPPGPPTRPNAGHVLDFQALITEGKEVANRVTFISAGGIFSELSGVIGNEKADLMNEYFFKAFMILCYVSLALGVVLHRLIKLNPNTQGFEMMVKITIYSAQGSLVYAISLAMCLLFPSKFGMTFILVVPLIPIVLVAVLSLAPRKHGSIP